MSNRLNFAKSQALMQIDQANSYTARLQEQKRLEDDAASEDEIQDALKGFLRKK